VRTNLSDLWSCSWLAPRRVGDEGLREGATIPVRLVILPLVGSASRNDAGVRRFGVDHGVDRQQRASFFMVFFSTTGEGWPGHKPARIYGFSRQERRLVVGCIRVKLEERLGEDARLLGPQARMGISTWTTTSSLTALSTLEHPPPGTTRPRSVTDPPVHVIRSTF